jgi:hypothetical protein
LKKNISPGLSTLNECPPCGCQKFTSSTCFCVDRKEYQLGSVSPIYPFEIFNLPQFLSVNHQRMQLVPKNGFFICFNPHSPPHKTFWGLIPGHTITYDSYVLCYDLVSKTSGYKSSHRISKRLPAFSDGTNLALSSSGTGI